MKKKTSNRPLSVFIWHALNDTSASVRVCEFLEAQGIKTWSKARNLLPGQKKSVTVENEIRSADSIILCISSISLSEEGPLYKELNFIIETCREKPEDQIFLIPLLINKCNVPLSLNAFESIEFFPRTKEEIALNKILISLEKRALSLGRKVPKQGWEYLNPTEWVELINRHSIGEFERVASMSFYSLRDSKSQVSVTERITEAIANNNREIVLFGDAGSGKTTLLKYMVYQYAKGYDLSVVSKKGLDGVTGLKIPLYFDRKAISTFDTVGIVDKLLLAHIQSLLPNKKFSSFQDLLSIPSTKWVLFFDDIDEMHNQSQNISVLRDWLALLPKNVQCVFSSRSTSISQKFGDFQLEIAPLEREEILYLVEETIKASSSFLGEYSKNKVFNEKIEKKIKAVINILDENPDMFNLLKRFRAVEGIAYFVLDAGRVVSEVEVDKDLINNAPDESQKDLEYLSALSLSTESLPITRQEDLISSEEFQYTINNSSDVELLVATDEDTIEKYSNQDQQGLSDREFKLGELAKAAIIFLRDEEFRRLEETSSKVYKDARKSFYMLKKIAWDESDWDFITFRSEANLLWSEHVGFIKEVEYPIYSFAEIITRCLFAAEFGLSDITDKEVAAKYKENEMKKYATTIINFYNDLRFANGKTEVEVSLEGGLR